jgi:hypothetical protein
MTIKTNKTAAEIMGCNDDQVNDYLQNILFGELINQGYNPNKYDYLRIVRFIEQVQLNPLDRTMYVRIGDTGFEPCLRVDGWLEISRKIGVKSIQHEYSDELISFTGMHPDVKAHVWIKATIVTNDGGEYSHREYFAENFCQNSNWLTMPNRLTGHKSLVQTLRMATGVYSAGDEFDSVTAQAVTVRPLTVDVDTESDIKVDVKPEMEAQIPRDLAVTTPQPEPVVEEDKPQQQSRKVQQLTPGPTQKQTSADESGDRNGSNATDVPTPEQAATPSVKTAETDADTECNVEGSAVNETPESTDANPAATTNTMTMDEVLQTQIDGFLPTRKIIGDMKIALTRCVELNSWKNVKAYLETTKSWNDQERKWTLGVLKIWADVCGVSQ